MGPPGRRAAGTENIKELSAILILLSPTALKPSDEPKTKRLKKVRKRSQLNIILMLISQLLNTSLMSDLDISDAELDLTLHFEDEDSEEFDIEEDSDGEYSEEEYDSEIEEFEEEEEDDSGEDYENSDEIDYD